MQGSTGRTHDLVGRAIHLNGHARLEVVGGHLGSVHHQARAPSGQPLLHRKGAQGGHLAGDGGSDGSPTQAQRPRVAVGPSASECISHPTVQALWRTCGRAAPKLALTATLLVRALQAWDWVQQ